MKTKNMMLGAAAFILIAALIVGALFIETYNTLVAKDTNVENMQARVQTAYQRRADLIPNLVETVKGARDFEKETITEITALRSKAGEIQKTVSEAKDVSELQAAGDEMGSVLSRLLVIVEAYPELKSNQNFIALQDELAGTENRIKYERDEYNNAVRDYRTYVRSFPTNMLAGFFGFSADKWTMFQAEEGAENAPEVDFST